MQEKVLYDDATIGDQQIGNNDIVYLVHAISGALTSECFYCLLASPCTYLRWSRGCLGINRHLGRCCGWWLTKKIFVQWIFMLFMSAQLENSYDTDCTCKDIRILAPISAVRVPIHIFIWFWSITQLLLFRTLMCACCAWITHVTWICMIILKCKYITLNQNLIHAFIQQIVLFIMIHKIPYFAGFVIRLVKICNLQIQANTNLCNKDPEWDI